MLLCAAAGGVAAIDFATLAERQYQFSRSVFRLFTDVPFALVIFSFEILQVVQKCHRVDILNRENKEFNASAPHQPGGDLVFVGVVWALSRPGKAPEFVSILVSFAFS